RPRLARDGAQAPLALHDLEPTAHRDDGIGLQLLGTALRARAGDGDLLGEQALLVVSLLGCGHRFLPRGNRARGYPAWPRRGDSTAARARLNVRSTSSDSIPERTTAMAQGTVEERLRALEDVDEIKTLMSLYTRYWDFGIDPEAGDAVERAGRFS